jgi:hypothetical protein
MTIVLVLMGGVAVVMLVCARSETMQLKAVLSKKLPPTQYLPKAVSMILIVAQLSELLKMVEHVSIVHVAAALLLLTMVVATRSGTEMA